MIYQLNPDGCLHISLNMFRNMVRFHYVLLTYPVPYSNRSQLCNIMCTKFLLSHTAKTIQLNNWIQFHRNPNKELVTTMIKVLL